MQHEPRQASSRVPAALRSTPRVKVKGHPNMYFKLREGRRVYTFNYRDSRGAMHWREIAGSLDDALAVQDELKGKRRRGERIVAAKNSPTVEEYASAWLARKHNLAPGTRATYEGHVRNHIARVLGPVRVSKLTDEDVLALLADEKIRRLRPATQAGVLRVFGTMLQRAVRDGLLPSNPVRLLERDERPKLTSDDESDVRALPTEHIARLLGGAAKIEDDGRARDMLAVAVFSGLRQSGATRAPLAGHRPQGRVPSGPFAGRAFAAPVVGVEDEERTPRCDLDAAGRASSS